LLSSLQHGVHCTGSTWISALQTSFPLVEVVEREEIDVVSSISYALNDLWGQLNYGLIMKILD